MLEARTMATGLRFPEGPVALPDGSVVLVEIERGTVTRVSPEGDLEVVAHLGGGPNGAALGPEGKLYVCNNGGFTWSEVPWQDGTLLVPGIDAPEEYEGGSIQVVDLGTGAVDTLYDAYEGRRLRGPNDIAFDSHGGFYFTDHGKAHHDVDTADQGALYYARADGSSISRVAHPISFPNGVALSPDGSRLYAAETMAGRLWWWDVVAPGDIAGGETFLGQGGGNFLYSAGRYELFDSMAVEADGNVCQATLLNPGITVVAPSGDLVEFVDMPLGDPAITNICFGGPDMRTAFVTGSATGTLYSFAWPRPGAELPYAST